MKNKTPFILLICALTACQPDIETISRRQDKQLSEVREMRAKAMAGVERRKRLRAEAAYVGAQVDSLNRFILGMDYKD